MIKKPVTAIIVGAGHRALLYASYAQHHPDELAIVGVAEPNELRRQQTAATYGLRPSACFSSAHELAAHGKIADVIINGTMDREHIPTSLPLLKVGYNMLLEKPFAINEEEVWQLASAARQHKNTVMVCHVLRYAPFYVAIRQLLAQGIIGQVLNVQTTEHVSSHHMAVAFVRGKWSNSERSGSSMLVAKCCHDMDLLAWIKSGVRPREVGSFGGLMYFRPEQAPQGAGTRCLVDCAIEPDCLYSAKKQYIDHPERWKFYVWDDLQGIEQPSIAQKIESLKNGSPYGRCVWKCDNNVVDHQSVMVKFEDGSTATHNMVGGAARASRSIHVLGTLGEIKGNFEDSKFVVRHIDPRPGCEYREEVVDVQTRGDMHGAYGGHGGGDSNLVRDFVRVIRGESASISTTTLDDSIYGHLIGFCADRSMKESRIVEIVRNDGA
jgi:predicted dehydrogenase